MLLDARGDAATVLHAGYDRKRPPGRRRETYSTVLAAGARSFCRFGRLGTKSSSLMRSITSTGTLGLAANLARDGLAVASIPTLSLAGMASGLVGSSSTSEAPL